MSQQGLDLIWIDLEMTGLQPKTDRIIEIATIITDKELNILAEGPVIAIYQSEAVLSRMDEWNVNQHQKSGLVDRVRASHYDERQAEEQTLDFLKKHIRAGVSPMCGNSICQDRRFLAEHMPELEHYFHYRQIDVSTLKELARRWRPEILDGLQKDSRHRALDDIYDSIAELRYYREKIQTW
ncbi:MAG: Exonuclease, RNase and polymerase [Gammaproteobacteria bacterium]|nr:Exonuclease, RNase and polymerase [Gammaproteobacteria bacterium]